MGSDRPYMSKITVVIPTCEPTAEVIELSGGYRRRVDTWPYCFEAQLVAIEGMTEISRYPEYRALVKSSQHVRVLSDLGLRKGCAIYERMGCVPAGTDTCKAHASYCTPEVARAGL
jgi:hypothetical protein